MTTALCIFASVVVLITFGPILLPHGDYAPVHDRSRAAASHALTAPQINYAGNPYRVGAYVYVMEDSAPSAHDWCGTFLGMSNGMAMVRDRDSLVVAHVNRDQLYSAQR